MAAAGLGTRAAEEEAGTEDEALVSRDETAGETPTEVARAVTPRARRQAWRKSSVIWAP